jgi:hypothetical protein
MDWIYEVLKPLVDTVQSKKKADPKGGSFQYRVFEEQTFWRWWASLPTFGVTIISTKIFVSKSLAKEDMIGVLKTFGLEIKA